MPPKADTTPERFWNRTENDESGCINWLGYTLPKGYGMLWWDGKKRLAHRVAFMLKHGSYPPGDKMVCHSCDNPRCVNPDHLWVGTAKDNLDDMQRKGRKVVWNKGTRREECPKGHGPLSPYQNRSRNRTGWTCNPCRREREKR